MSLVSGTGRMEYLLDGRRVTVSDLIAAGLLAAGTELVFRRKRAGAVHRATVRQDGWLVLDDGRPVRSPSRAAAVAASAQAFDGWHAWVVEDTDRSLDSLRQELLDNLAEELPELEADQPDTQKPHRERHYELKHAKDRAEADQPIELPVRELLKWWGVDRRENLISQQMEADLANYGLRTSPNFLKVTPETLVRIVSMASDRGDDVTADAASGSTEPDAPAEARSVLIGPDTIDEDEQERPTIGLSIGNLPSALGSVKHVTPQSSIEQAITEMLLNDFSQLAVLSGVRGQAFAVSWKSIAQARNVNPEATLADATFPAVEARYEEELIDVLPRLQAHDFVLVRDETNAIRGIVTTTDVVAAYQNLATPFMLIGTLDQKLRRIVVDSFPMADIARICDPSGRRASLGPDDLTLGDYERVLENPAMWAQLNWSLDRSAFLTRLKLLRRIRNDVMHFNPDPLPPDAVPSIRNMLNMLESYGAQ